jgi:hypothetical protein
MKTTEQKAEERFDLIYAINDIVWQCHMMTENATTDFDPNYIEYRINMLVSDVKELKGVLTKIKESK